MTKKDVSHFIEGLDKRARNFIASAALEGVEYTEAEIRFLESLRHLPEEERIAILLRRHKQD